MTFRKRRILAALLALALCLSLLPMSALAAEADALGETGPEEAVCTCTAPCTEGGMNTACPVCGAEGAAPEDCGQSLPQGSGEAKTQPLANEGISLLSTQEDVYYIDPTEEQTEQTCDSATVVTESDRSWGLDDNAEHWYVVNGNVTIDRRVTVNGNVHLILADGCNLTVNGGINVSEGNSLTIYAQSAGEGMGKLITTGSVSVAGIGGIWLYEADPANCTSGTITINGGMVTATGGYNSAGIGGSSSGGAGGTITINGGTVTATGGINAAGIGGDGGSITINSGTVTATGGSGGAGIGSGRESSAGGTITINGGHVTANGSQGSQQYYSAGIGGGFKGAGGSITINGGVVEAHGGWTGIGSGEQASAESTCEVTVKGGVVTATGDNSAGIGGTFSTGEDGHAVIIADGKDDNEISDDGNTTGWSGLIITKTQGEGKIYGSDSFEIVNDLEIPEGYTLTIENGETLTIPTGVTLNNNGTIICNGTINGTVGGDVRYPSAVTVSVNQGDQSVTSVAYGSTITITATMTKQIATNALTAAVGTVDFWLGEVDTGTKLGSANVTGSGSTYTATLEVTLDDATNWIPNDTPYTITADFGGVEGTSSGDGLISSAGSATLTVTKGNQTAPDAPTMSSRTTDSVTLDAISGGQGTVQYGYVQGDSGTPGSWQDDTFFNDLQPGTDYTFYARYAGNDYYEPSPASGGLTVTTLPEIITTDLNAGYVGVPYNATLEASANDSKTVTWTGSSLPAGLALNNDGTITGTPSTAGTFSFTVQVSINGTDGTQPVTNTATLSITINAGTSDISITSGSDTYTYGETITINGKITASNQTPNNGINSITEPEQNRVGLYLGDTQLATANVTNGSFTITYDTAGQSIPIGNNQTLTVRYGGSSDLTSGSATVSITLNPKSVTAQVQGEITKVYDGNTDAAVNLAVASGDLVNDDDEITVTGTGTYSSADVGTNISVTVSNIQTTGDDSAWYTVSAPTGVTGAITKATQEAPNGPSVIERTSSSVTLAALGTTGQGALEYGYTTGAEGEPDNWQTETTFSGLTSGTTYTFYARYAGNNNYNPAISVTGTETSTLSNADPNVVNPGETVTTDDGTKVTNDGEKITITPDDGGTTTTITPDKGATVNGDGSVNVPGGSTVTTGDGPSITVGEGGATVGTDGGVTLPDGGSATIGSGDDTTTITTPGGGTIDPDTGAVTPDEGGSVTIGSGDDTTTITPPSGQPVTPNDDGTITVPDGSTVQTGDGPEMTLPGGGTIDPDTGAVTPGDGGSVTIGSGDDTTTITPPSGQPVTPNDDGSITIPGGSTVTGSDGESITIPPEGGTLQPGGEVEYTVTVTFDSQGGSQVPSQDITVGEPASQPDDPTRTGYRFLGWYTAATGGARWDFTQPVTGDQTLYAQWAYLPPANPNYKITIGDTENGTVTVNPTAAKEGTTVTITPVPDAGYQVGTVSVTDRFGQAVAVDQQADGTYTFVMPDGQVTVEVTFLQGEAPDLPFSDVTESDWFYDAVTYAYENGLMDGVGAGLFAPNSETTRAQLVTILHRLAGQPAPSGDSGFSDVETGTWYTDAVAWAAQNGIVNGVSDTQFAPGDDITREQLAVILYRYATYQGYDVSQRADLSGFVDAGTISTYAQEALSWANAQGLVLGFEDDSLRPQGNASRAQIAAVLMRFCQTVAE